MREFIDKERPVARKLESVLEEYRYDIPALISLLKKLMEEDPYYLETYIYLSEILENEGHIKEAEEVLLEAYQKAMPFWKAWDLKNSNLPLERTAATIQNRWKVGSINTEKNLKNSLETKEFFAKSPYSSCFNLCYTRNGSIQNFCNFFQRQFFIKN